MGLRAYQKIESGESKLDVERMQELANVFKVSMLDLVKTDNNINISKIEHVGGISSQKITVNHNNPIDEIKAAFVITLKSKDDLITELRDEISFLKKELRNQH